MKQHPFHQRPTIMVTKVWSEITCQEPIFTDVENRQLFEQVLVDAAKKYDFTVQRVLLAGYRVELDLVLEDESMLSKIMHWINGVYAMRFNRLHERFGHLWYLGYKRFGIYFIKETDLAVQSMSEKSIDSSSPSDLKAKDPESGSAGQKAQL